MGSGGDYSKENGIFDCGVLSFYLMGWNVLMVLWSIFRFGDLTHCLLRECCTYSISVNYRFWSMLYSDVMVLLVW